MVMRLLVPFFGGLGGEGVPPEAPPLPPQPPAVEIVWGDDNSDFANDGECDDPRFSGDGHSGVTSRNYVQRDATDCRAAYETGVIVFEQSLPVSFIGVHDGIDFGDNSAGAAFDEECDDPRFTGPGVFGGAHRSNVGRDADDCRAQYIIGQAGYQGELPPAFTGVYEGVDFGSNESSAAFDEECDDGRFRGFGMATPPYFSSNQGQDAADCQALFADGFIVSITAQLDFNGLHQGIDFGDNSGLSTRDGVCDDPRFRGPAMRNLNTESQGQDAADCRFAFDEGSIVFDPAPQPDGETAAGPSVEFSETP